MAFALHKFAGDILDYDPRFVRWMVRTWTDRSGERTEEFLPLHECSDEDLSKFFDAESEETYREV